MTRPVIRLALAAALMAPSVLAADPKEKVIPVEYNGTLLVVTTADGVAAFAFTDRVDKGTGYKFRFRPADGGKEEAGAGKIFERYKAVQGPGGPNDVSYQYDGGDLYLTAGPVKVLWSRGDAGSGWLYFDPAKVTVRERKAAEFDRIELKAFGK